MTAGPLHVLGDGVLVVAIGRFNHDALREAYRRHAGPVFALALRLIGDKERAEDVTQEVFLKLWDDPQRFDADRGPLRSYLLSIAHGRSIDFIRSESSRRRREMGNTDDLSAEVDSLEREVVDLAIAEEVRTAYDGLPDEERECIQLTYFGGNTYREAARLLGQPEGTVKGRIRAGLKRMKTDLIQVVEER